MAEETQIKTHTVDPQSVLNLPTLTKNSRGSSAGAGSGDCQTYVKGRRKEIIRIEEMKTNLEREHKNLEWQRNIESRKKEIEKKQQNNRRKRELRKFKGKEIAEARKKQKIEETIKNDRLEV